MSHSSLIHTRSYSHYKWVAILGTCYVHIYFWVMCLLFSLSTSPRSLGNIPPMAAGELNPASPPSRADALPHYP